MHLFVHIVTSSNLENDEEQWKFCRIVMSVYINQQTNLFFKHVPYFLSLSLVKVILLQLAIERDVPLEYCIHYYDN